MKMFFKGFGYSLIVLLISVSLQANDLPAKQESLNNDTSIAVTEVDTASIYPDGSDENSEQTQKNNTPQSTDYPKTLLKAEYTNRILHPMAIAFVNEYERKHEKRLSLIASKFYQELEAIENILIKYELPTDLKYLAFIESELKNSAVSRKGAVGPWQFMPATGRLMGLTINQHRDDRRNLIKSTNAAAKYLRILYNQFNDWLLVIAAYNGGAGRVESAIRRSQSRDFWNLQYYLPAESRQHVKKYIAASYILEKQQEEDIIPTIDMDRLVSRYLNHLSVIHIVGKYDAFVIARKINMEMEEFNQYNPGFEEAVAGQGYDLKLPKEKMDEFKKKRQQILQESVEILLENKGTVFSDDRSNHPDTILHPERNAIVSTAGQQKNLRRK